MSSNTLCSQGCLKLLIILSPPPMCFNYESISSCLSLIPGTHGRRREHNPKSCPLTSHVQCGMCACRRTHTSHIMHSNKVKQIRTLDIYPEKPPDTEMSSKHMKRYSLLVIREMQIKITLSYCLIPAEMTISKKQKWPGDGDTHL